MKSITLPNNLTSIEGSVFGNTGLTSIDIPNSVTSIGEYAFNETSLKSIVIPNRVTSIGIYTFYKCQYLVSVKSEIKTPFIIGDGVFQGIPSSSILQVPKGTKEKYQALSSWAKNFNEIVEYSIDYNLNISASGNGSIYFNGTTIRNNSNSFTVTEGDNVTISISPDTDYRIKHIILNGTDVKSNVIDNKYTIKNVNSDNTVEIEFEAESPIITFADAYVKDICLARWDTDNDGELSESEAAAVTDIGTVFCGNTTITSFEEFHYFTGIQMVPSSAFKGCTSLKQITIPNSAVSIGEDAFNGCRFETIIIPNTVTKIEKEAFFNCMYLQSLYLPQSVTSISDMAFRNCTVLKSIKVDEDNTIFDSRDDCNAIIETATNTLVVGSINTVIPNGVTKIGNYAFEGRRAIETIVIPNTVTIIGKDAFHGCNLASIIIPNSVTSIDDLAFEYCKKLTSLTIPENVTHIGNYVIRFSSNITSLTVESGNKTYDSRNNCNAIIETATNTLVVGCKSTEIPQDVTSLGTTAFTQCDALEKITLPKSIEKIGYRAFQGCSNLTEVISKIKEPFVISDYVFNEISSSAILKVPEGTKEKYQNISSWASKFNSIEEIINSFSLSVKATGYGAAVYNDITIRNNSSSFATLEGSSAIVTFTPDEGYRIKSVKLNGTDITSAVTNNQYTISGINSDNALEVEFEQMTYSLSITATGNGSVTYDETTVRGKSSAFTISYGNNVTISIVPDDGYRIKSVKLNETDITSTIKNNQYTITDIKANSTLEVVFEQIPNYTISIVSEGNGKVTYGSSIIKNQSKEFTIRESNSISLSFTPDNGYRLASVIVNGVDKIAYIVNSQLTIENISADMTIEVSFEAIPPTTYTLIIKATGNGSVTYNGTAIRGKSSSFTIVEGTSTIVTFTPDDGYSIKSVKLNETDITSTVKNNQYTISNISSNITLEVEYEAITYTLSIKAVGNGSVTYDETVISGKTSTFTVSYGADAVVSFTPDEGYRIKSVKVNGTDVTSNVENNQYTITNITTDTSLEVEFERITYTLSITATGSGTISYNDVSTRGKTNTFNVVESSSAKLSIIPDEGYRIKSLMVNSVDVTSDIRDGKYTISNVTANTTIEVIFEAIPNFTISILATGNGNVGYNGTMIRNQSQSYSVREGGSITISFSPDKGYRVASVTANKTDMTGQIVDGQLTISNISSNTSIEVVFEEIPPTTYSLTVKVGDNGSVTYDGTAIRNKSNTFTVVEGTYVTVTITPDNGYRVKSVKLNNVDVTSNVKNNQYTISGIGSNTSVEVEFEEMICTLSITSIGNGSVTYEGTAVRDQSRMFSVPEGTTSVVVITPDEGYRIKSVTLNETDVTSTIKNNQYTITDIKANSTLEVVFMNILAQEKEPYAVLSDNNTVLTFYYDDQKADKGGMNVGPFTGYPNYQSWYNQNKSITSVVFDASFAECTSLTSTSFWFWNCNHLTSIEGINYFKTDNVTNMSAMFSGCSSLTSLDLSSFKTNGVTDMHYMFFDCSSLISLDLSSFKTDNVTEMSGLFSGCSSLTSLDLSSFNTSHVNDMSDMFYGCESLTILDLSSFYTLNVTDMSEMFSSCSSLKTIYVGNGWNTSGVDVFEEMFEGCVNLVGGKGTVFDDIHIGIAYAHIDGGNANPGYFTYFRYILSVSSTGNGVVIINGTTLRGQTKTFEVEEGSAITLAFVADEGCRVKSVILNGIDVISSVENNNYTISNITCDTGIEVEFEIITYTLSIKSSGNGTVTCEGTEIRDKTKTFTIAEGTSAVVVITPDEGYRIKSVTLNETDVTSKVVNYMYSFKIESNVTLEIEFMEDVMEFAVGNVNYKVVSYSDKTIQLASGNYGATLTVPATCTANDRQWTVIGVETNALANCTDLAAIIWNPEVQFNGNIKNPNLLLYVKDKKYAPTTVRNVVVDNVAEEITLSDAESGNPFYCPKAFTAQRIIYEHNYSMTSGYQKCQGWETLVLPFNVTTILRQNGTEIVPRETWVQGSNKLPFWLYTLTELGWRPETTIAANTPYIISMPNNENYNSKYNISGVIQFIGTNVEVKTSDNMPIEKNGNKILAPNYQYLPASESMYALNVNNQWCTNTTTEAEGSVFFKNLRPVHPFEAYLSVSGADAAKRLIPIFEDDETCIMELQNDGIMELQNGTYDMTGRKVQGELKRGVYIVDGKKVLVK